MKTGKMMNVGGGSDTEMFLRFGTPKAGARSIGIHLLRVRRPMYEINP